MICRKKLLDSGNQNKKSFGLRAYDSHSAFISVLFCAVLSSAGSRITMDQSACQISKIIDSKSEQNKRPNP
jgi:hypothetical protein